MDAESDVPFALVVEDNAIILMDAMQILEDAGFRTLDARSVEEALGLLDQHRDQVTLLFTDVQMDGDRDGFDLARQTARLYPEIKILVASGARSPEPGQMPDGAIFLTKPFSAEVVYERLQELLPDGQKPEPLKRKAANNEGQGSVTQPLDFR